MSKQEIEQILGVQRPTTKDTVIWNMYWERQGQPWRNQPEIDAERQEYLGKRRYRALKEGKLIEPLRDIPLSRADIEWLLAIHERGRGPVDWNDVGQRQRKGLHLCKADLRNTDLSNLPLANVDLSDAHLEGALLSDAHLESANLVRAHLEYANLGRAYLEDALLLDVHLEGASIGSAHLEGAMLMQSHVEGADLSNCFFDARTNLNSVTLFSQETGGVTLADVRWGDVNLAVVDWSALAILGDESGALHLSGDYATPRFKLEFLKRATRAYRQLSVVLRNQGLTEDAARFAYRAQLMQRKVFWHQRKFGQYLFSLFLDLLAGYAFKARRSFAAYLIVIAAFAMAYFIVGHTVGPALSPLSSVVFSMTSFHGRGFFPGGIGLDDPLTVLAALEAFVGLLIEVTFIATLTQRLFGK